MRNHEQFPLHVVALDILSRAFLISVRDDGREGRGAIIVCPRLLPLPPCFARRNNFARNFPVKLSAKREPRLDYLINLGRIFFESKWAPLSLSLPSLLKLQLQGRKVREIDSNESMMLDGEMVLERIRYGNWKLTRCGGKLKGSWIRFLLCNWMKIVHDITRNKREI